MECCRLFFIVRNFATLGVVFASQSSNHQYLIRTLSGFVIFVCAVEPTWTEESKYHIMALTRSALLQIRFDPIAKKSRA
jgi:hypothetical protein